MAPTTMENQITKTSPRGREVADVGYPIKACEMLNTLESPVYIERTSVHDVKNIKKTKKAIYKALKNQRDGRGYSFVEILSMCPTNWGVQPQVGADWVRDTMVPYYPLGNFRDR